MATSKPIKEEKFTGHLTETKKDEWYSTITYRIDAFTVTRPNDLDFEVDISSLIERLFEGGNVTTSNTRSLKMNEWESSQDLRYHGKLFDSSILLEVRLYKGKDGDITDNKRPYSIQVSLSCETIVTGKVRERIEKTLYPIISQYAERL